MAARILIVEDETLVAMELCLVLEDLGYRVVDAVADRASALNVVAENEVELALIDIHLSDGPSGLALGRDLADQGVSVLFLTANPGMVGAETIGVVGVLSKPVEDRTVQTAVEYALQSRAGQVSGRAPAALHVFAEAS